MPRAFDNCLNKVFIDYFLSRTSTRSNDTIHKRISGRRTSLQRRLAEHLSASQFLTVIFMQLGVRFVIKLFKILTLKKKYFSKFFSNVPIVKVYQYNFFLIEVCRFKKESGSQY
jgi:hypothetical protein